MASLKERLREWKEFRAVAADLGRPDIDPENLKKLLLLLKEERDTFLEDRNRALSGLKFTHHDLKNYQGQVSDNDDYL